MKNNKTNEKKNTRSYNTLTSGISDTSNALAYQFMINMMVNFENIIAQKTHTHTHTHMSKKGDRNQEISQKNKQKMRAVKKTMIISSQRSSHDLDVVDLGG